jgi:5-(carboxyamino)imidazole ribonucleotide synthase
MASIGRPRLSAAPAHIRGSVAVAAAMRAYMTGRCDAIGSMRIGAHGIGIVGAGQLARMTIQAASALGIDSVVLAAGPDDAATQLAGRVLVGSPRDSGQLWALAARSEVVTFDHEHVDLDLLGTLERAGVAVRPGPTTLSMGVDKALMRRTLAAAGVSVPAHAFLDADPDRAHAQAVAFGETYGWPVVLKATRGGYNGRGVWPAANPAQAAVRCQRAAEAGITLLVENHVDIDVELAVLVARRPNGEVAVWPAVETTQVTGMCREVLLPGRVDAALGARARALGEQVAVAVGATGVLAIEMFASGGDLLVNELAARPHNSGHWTMDGSLTSQFENHVRAIFDWPLGAVEAIAPVVASVNVLGGADGGSPTTRLAAALAVPGAHVHLYGKSPVPGRKLGHVTVWGTDPADVRDRAWRCAVALGTPVPTGLLVAP